MMKRCVKCTLPETYPGINFDSAGRCNYCYYFDVSTNLREFLKNDLTSRFHKIMSDAKRYSKEYDCLVCYSGGKDSTFLLLELKEKYNLRIMAFTLNNGYLSERALMNIKTITQQLKIKHVMVHPEQRLINKIFRAALTKQLIYPKEITAILSPLCATCQGMILAAGFKLAVENDIPIVFIGFTPAQYPDISYENFLKSGSCIYFSDSVYKDDPPDIIKIIKDPIDEIIGEKVDKYFLGSQYLPKGGKYPHVLFPFHALFEYNEKVIYEKIQSKGWIKPHDTDVSSTNCLINTLSNYAFIKQHGYHPYIAEISMLVRRGFIPYQDAVKMEELKEDSEAMRISLDKLGLLKKDICKEDEE